MPSRTQSVASAPLDYPFSFPDRCASRVRAAMLRADEEFAKGEKSYDWSDDERHRAAILWISTIAAVFAEEACALAGARVPEWTALEGERRMNEVIRLLVLEAEASKFVGGNKPQLAEGPYPKEKVLAQILGSDEVSEYREKLLHLLEQAATSEAILAQEKSENETRSPEVRFPARATWLKERLRERGWNKNDVSRNGGPDRKSVQKILDGLGVREDILDKLVTALSHSSSAKKLPAVSLKDVPDR